MFDLYFGRIQPAPTATVFAPALAHTCKYGHVKFTLHCTCPCPLDLDFDLDIELKLKLQHTGTALPPLPPPSPSSLLTIYT